MTYGRKLVEGRTQEHAMNILRSIVALTLLVLGTGVGAASKAAPENIPGSIRVNAEQLIDLYGNYPETVLIDSRTEEDFKRGYIEGAVNLPDTQTTPATLARHASEKDRPVVFYCNGVNCGRSAVSAGLAVQWGYSKVFWFRGGIVEWREKRLPIVR